MKDKELIELFCLGDESAVCELINRYGRLIYYLCLRVTKKREDAEECYNDSLYSLWKNIPITKPNCLKLYIEKTVYNVSLSRVDYKMAKKRNEKLGCDIERVEFYQHSISETDLYIERACILQALERFFSDISLEKADIFKEKYCEDKLIKDIAVEHNISISKTKMMLSRMKKLLKKYLEEENIYL